MILLRGLGRGIARGILTLLGLGRYSSTPAPAVVRSGFFVVLPENSSFAKVGFQKTSFAQLKSPRFFAKLSPNKSQVMVKH